MSLDFEDANRYRNDPSDVFNDISIETLVSIASTTTNLSAIRRLYAAAERRASKDPRSSELEEAKTAVYVFLKKLEQEVHHDVALTAIMSDRYADVPAELAAEENERIALFKAKPEQE